MGIETAIGGARAAASLPVVRPTAPAGRLRSPGPSSVAPAVGSVVFDEAIDIQLGLDGRTGHLAIVRGDVRIQPRSSSRPAPGRPAAPSPGSIGPPPVGSLVNVRA